MKRYYALALWTCALAACGSHEDPTDYLTVRAEVRNLGGQIGMTVEQPGRSTTVKHAQLDSNNAIAIPTVYSGNLRVSFVLVASAGDTISHGLVQLALQKGFIYSVSVTRRPANYLDVCFNCTGSAKIPIHDTQKPTTDSLSLLYSAMPLCKGCVL